MSKNTADKEHALSDGNAPHADAHKGKHHASHTRKGDEKEGGKAGEKGKKPKKGKDAQKPGKKNKRKKREKAGKKHDVDAQRPDMHSTKHEGARRKKQAADPAKNASAKKKAKGTGKASRRAHDNAADEADALLRSMRCPCCKHRCPLTKPKCGKGRAVRAKTIKRL